MTIIKKIQYDLKAGKAFNDLVGAYPISGESLLRMCKVLCEFVELTQITDIEKYFFVDMHRCIPRIPFMLDFEEQYRTIANKIISDLRCEMCVDEQGENTLNVGTNEYAQKWKYEIGVNYGLHKAISIIKEYAQML